jgi:hypothetical protein
MMTRRAPLVLSLTLCGQRATAQEWTIKPTKEHELLKKDVGTWDATVKVWPMEGAKPMESKGVEKNELLDGGLWLLTRFEGDVVGTKFTGIGTFGYDPKEKKYIGNWVDTMSPYPMITKSDYDAKTNTLTGTADVQDPYSGEKYTAKMISRYNDDGTRTMEMHRKQKDGKEWKTMEISYKQSKE